MSTPLTIAHVAILLTNLSIVALGIYVNLMIPEHPAMTLEIALGSGFFLGTTIPALIGLRSYKGTARGITLTMCLVTGQAVFIAWFFSKDLTASYLSTFLSMIIGLSSAILVVDLQFLRKISRMSLIPNVIKSTATVMIAFLLTPGLAPVFAFSDLRHDLSSL